MNDDRSDQGPHSESDRVILDYLQDILRDPAARPVTLPVVVADNVADFASSRARKLDISAASLQSAPLHAAPLQSPFLQSAPLQEARQAVALPFRTAEKSRVLTSPGLLNPQPQPAPVEIPEPAKPEFLLPEPTQPVHLQPEPPQPEPPQPVSATAPSALQAPAEVPVAPEPSAKTEAPIVTEAVAVTEPPAVTKTPPSETDLETALEASTADALLPQVQPWQDNGRPVWARQRFECLIFEVGGLKLAVPLITLGAIHRIDRKFNALPHQSNWFIGILQTPASGNIKVLDTALCVMPERYDPASRSQLNFVISLHGYAWGLACHAVSKSITLEPDQVKWRTQRGKRPWLAGTVIEHMCALIDTDGFRDLILQAEQSR